MALFELTIFLELCGLNRPPCRATSERSVKWAKQPRVKNGGEKIVSSLLKGFTSRPTVFILLLKIRDWPFYLDLRARTNDLAKMLQGVQTNYKRSCTDGKQFLEEVLDFHFNFWHTWVCTTSLIWQGMLFVRCTDSVAALNCFDLFFRQNISWNQY